MAKYTDVGDFIRAQSAQFERISKQARPLHLQMVQRVAATTKAQLLSGTTTQAELDRMGNPFGRGTSRRYFKREAIKGRMRLSSRGFRARTRLATRGVGIAIPLLPINRQSNRLVKSEAILRLPPPHPLGQELKIAYRAPYAQYVLGQKGTSKTVPRGFLTAKSKIEKREQRDFEVRLRYLILTATA